MRIIRCENVSLAYEGKTVVQHLTMEVHDGEYLCIVGENGSGKTTLMRALLGLKKPAAGSIRFENGLQQTDIGYMPQQTAVQRDFPATVREVVQSGLRGSAFWPFLRRAQRARLLEMLTLLEIDGIAGSAYRELSGGQQQRVLLARAMCAAGRVLLLDEPAAGLDPAVTAQLYALISRLHAAGMTIIMISHDIPAAVKYATRILHLRHEPLFFGAADAYLDSVAGQRFLKGGET